MTDIACGIIINIVILDEIQINTRKKHCSSHGDFAAFVSADCISSRYPWIDTLSKNLGPMENSSGSSIMQLFKPVIRLAFLDLIYRSACEDGTTQSSLNFVNQKVILYD